MSPLLEVTDLRIAFGRSRREVVHGVSFSLEPGERLGLIGESGSGNVKRPARGGARRPVVPPTAGATPARRGAERRSRSA